MKYKIIHDLNSQDVQEAVQRSLNEGWVLHGGVAVAQSEIFSKDKDGYEYNEFNRIFVQAMVKLENEDSE